MAATPRMSGSGATRRDLPSCMLIRERLLRHSLTRTVGARHGDGLLIHWLYENTEVLSRSDGEDGHVEFDVRVPRGRAGELDQHLRRAAH